LITLGCQEGGMVKVSGLSLLEHTDKAGPLKDPLALLLFSVGIEKYFHSHRPEDFPRVSTRGHIDLCRVQATPLTPDGWVGKRLGVPKSLFLTEGHGETDYETNGEIPGFGDGEDGQGDSPEELIVFVHGWLSDEEAALGRMSLLRYTLERNGYRSPVVGFTWDTDQTVLEWESGKVIANWNGPKLARFTVDYKKRNPDTKLRYISNSLGAHPVFEALKTLDDFGYEDLLESASVMGGSVPSGSVSVGGEYADAVRNVVGDLYNYRTTEDRTLNLYYRMAEGADAVGGAGTEGETPENYHDRRVDYVPDHFSFMLPKTGCVEEVVRDFGVDPPESLKDAEVTKSLKAFGNGTVEATAETETEGER
jgi:hypothetical protein